MMNERYARMSNDEFIMRLHTRLVGKFCRHCANRVSRNKSTFCSLQTSHQSLNGYKTIHAYDDACGLYEERI